jgi:germacradienol/geosmin synthase
LRLPEFYLPWPARVNPSLDAVRERGLVWARGVGMFDEGVWDEAKFEGADLARAAAYTFPDAPPALLALLADWGAWAFYVDDLFLERFKRSGDREGALAYVESTSHLDVEQPQDAAQRALVDLWARTAPLMSEHWRERFAELTVHQLREMVWELDNIGAARVPNPIEYLRRRRGTAAGAWIAALVELANAAELRPDLVATRPMRVLRDSFGDAFLLRNDLFSYQREIEEEGEVNNGVLVLEHFLDLDPQDSAEVVNELITSRMQQFEYTFATELPLLFEERALGPVDRLAVLSYAKGLQDFQAGMHRWMDESPRYSGTGTEAVAALPGLPVPRGLGTAAVRLWQTHRPVLPRQRRHTESPTVAPGLAAFPSQINPHLEAVRDEVKLWTLRVGMLDGLVWTEDVFDDEDVIGWVARTHPEAARDRLARIAKWYVWRAYLDEVLNNWFAPRRDYLGARAYLFRLRDFLPADGVSVPPPASVVERALADLWPSTFADMPPYLRDAFPGHVSAFADGRLWELANRAQGRVPDSIDYLETRRETAAQGFATDLIRYALGIGPSAAMPETEEAFADIAAWAQDVRDYGAAVETEGSVNNGVLVLERLLGCTPEQAMTIANDLVAARLHEFDQASTHTGEEAGRYVDGLRAWLGGAR